LFADALKIYDHLLTIPELSKDTLFIMGRSLGTGIATYLLSQREVPGVILITPYDSMLSIAHEKYPYFPTSLLLKHPLESIHYASLRPNIVIIFYAGKDIVVTNPHTEKLISGWNGKLEKYFYPEADHTTIMDVPDMQIQIENFLEKGVKS
jgi:uncharacterized protein